MHLIEDQGSCKVIVVEGVDAVGKTTLINDYIIPHYKDIIRTPIKCVSGLQSNFKSVALSLRAHHPIAELLVVLAAREQVLNRINYYCTKGYTVVCDRLDWTTRVMQLTDSNKAKLYEKVSPYLTRLSANVHYLLLDADTDVIKERLSIRSQMDDFETKDSAVIKARQSIYMQLYRNSRNASLIRTDQKPALIKQQVDQMIKDHFCN